MRQPFKPEAGCLSFSMPELPRLLFDSLTACQGSKAYNSLIKPAITLNQYFVRTESLRLPSACPLARFEDFQDANQDVHFFPVSYYRSSLLPTTVLPVMPHEYLALNYRTTPILSASANSSKLRNLDITALPRLYPWAAFAGHFISGE